MKRDCGRPAAAPFFLCPHAESPRAVYSIPCCRASLRDAIPKTLRLPRPRRGLAMTRLVSLMVLWHGFQNEKFEIRRRATPQRRFSESAISRGRKPAFHMRSILHLLEEQISLRSLSRASPLTFCTKLCADFSTFCRLVS